MGTVHSLAARRGAEIPSISDAQLVDAVIDRRHPRAQQQLYERFAPMVTRLAHRLLGGPEVDDVVQDVFLVAFETLPKLREPAGVKGWLRSITLNTVRKRIRRRALRRRLGFAGEPLEPERIVGEGADPALAAELQELYRILESLPADVRIALVLRRVEGLTMPEVAESMDKSLSTVKRRVQEGEACLERAIAERRQP